ncbi:COG3904 family protein [Sabulicella rubraurantiaca]|uniref:COG3904 family protein n=1 Tax=Sabulicella rubraurantiaca TaxID=2811429 RepID=UPI001A960EB9|nr:hypothetical protein [Sabulicella rubraurantiaca]
MRLVWLGLLVLIAPFDAAAQSMSFAFHCFANASESCFVIAKGTLDGGAADRFDAFLDGPNGAEGFQVLLDSSGGSLQDGMALGRRIRAREFHTVVGQHDGAGFDPPNPGNCLSACAYAFLGGVGRRVPEGSQLGFHQFGLPGGAALPNAAGLAGGQEISGLLLTYIIEMGVDPRLFVLASATPSTAMTYPSLEQRLAYDIETPRGFDRFVLEPYRAGVIAVSKRRDTPRIYDQASQLTAFCRARAARLLLTVPGVPVEAGVGATLGFGPTAAEREIRPAQVSSRAAGDGAVFEVALTPEEAQALAQAREMRLQINAPRVAGGPHWMQRTLTSADRQTIAAAFRFCI